MRTLLATVRAFCQRAGLPIPAAVYGSADPQVGQIYGLMEELLEDLEDRKVWQQNSREATFTTVATESQGSILTIADAGFMQILPDTFFNRTTNLKVDTGLSAAKWQAIKAGPGAAGPFYRSRLRQNELLLTPTPPAGETMAFEYRSNAFIRNAANTAYLTAWASDSDQLVLPDSIGVSWLQFAWRRRKGLDYAEDQLTYERHIASLSIRDNTPRDINMAGCGGQPRSGVVVPIGSWNLP